MKYKYLITLCLGVLFLNSWSMEYIPVEPEFSEEDIPRGMNWGMETLFDAPNETKSIRKGSRLWKEKNEVIKEKNTRIEDFNNATNKSGKYWNDDKDLGRCVKNVYRNYRNITINFQNTNDSPLESMKMEEIYDMINREDLCQTNKSHMSYKEDKLCSSLRYHGSLAQESILDCWHDHLEREKNSQKKRKTPIQAPVCPRELSLNQLENLSNGAYLPIKGGYLWANETEQLKITNKILDVRSLFALIPMTTAILQPLELFCTYRYKGIYNESPVFIKFDLYDLNSIQINESEEAQNPEQERNLHPLPPEIDKQSKEEDSESFVSTLSSSSTETK